MGSDRAKLWDTLKTQKWDVVVIGGGATGAGCALDAATRGLKVLLVEKNDFAHGSSSKSTKLLHGGVRYLEQAVKTLDSGQYHLVREALEERARLLDLAPHLAHALPILTPLYRAWELPYYFAGLKIYDWLSGRHGLKSSQYVSRSRALELCPLLKDRAPRGGVLYYDGQFDDARLNLAIVQTAVREGAVALNYVEATGLTKRGKRIDGVELRDTVRGETVSVSTNVVINAGGPWVDRVRALDGETKAVLALSSGAHLIADVPGLLSTGVLLPKTDDGRVLFLLPWLGAALIGTTDVPATLPTTSDGEPKPAPEEIAFIVEQTSKHLGVRLAPSAIRSSWAGLRPLWLGTGTESTAQLSRDHHLATSPSGLITITGGKWTTYRRMAIDAVDEGVRVGQLSTARDSQTERTVLAGAEGYDADLARKLAREFRVEPDIAEHLAHTYGTRAYAVLERTHGRATRLHPRHGVLEAEVSYAIEEEWACRSIDFLARRTRLAFLDKQAVLECLPRVQAIFGERRHWDAAKLQDDARTVRDWFSTVASNAQARSNAEASSAS